MIAYLSGVVRHLLDDALVLDVNGVGYQVYVSTAMAHGSPPGQPLSLHIYHHIKEDTQQLFGFAQAEDRSLFTLLLSVSGVGPKVALKFFNTMSTERLVQAIAAEDSVALTAVPGVGKRLAERMTVELKGKVGPLSSPTLLTPVASHHADLILALKQLGYSADESRQAVSMAAGKLTAGLSLDQALKIVFKFLVTA